MLKIPNLLLLVAVLLFACNDRALNVSTLAANQDSNNVLMYEIKFSTDKEISTIIKYWEKNGSDTLITDSSKVTKNHEFKLINLEANSYYNFLIKDYVSGLNSEVYDFVTDSLPDTLPEITLTIDSGNVFQGYILARPFYNPGSQILLNNKGEIVWYQSYGESIFRPFFWTENNSVLALKDTFRIEEFDLYGNQLLELSFGENQYDKYLHHEIFKDKNKHIVSLSRVDKILDLSSLGGNLQDTVKGDGILILDESGNKIWEWSMFDIINPLEDPAIVRTKNDWSHGNAIGIDKDGHYLVSFKNFNQIWKVDSKSGELIWKLGKGGDFEMQDSSYFLAQHAVHINEDGHLMLFDNGDNDRPFTRIISFDLDEEKKIATQVLNIRLPHHLLTYRMGSAYQISSDRFLVSSPRKQGLISIVNLKGEVLWEVRLSRASYRAVYLPKARLNPYETSVN